MHVMLCCYAKLMESIKSNNTQDFTDFEFLLKSNMIYLGLKKKNYINHEYASDS